MGHPVLLPEAPVAAGGRGGRVGEKRIDSQENRLESSFLSSICQLTRFHRVDDSCPESQSALLRSRLSPYLARSKTNLWTGKVSKQTKRHSDRQRDKRERERINLGESKSK